MVVRAHNITGDGTYFFRHLEGEKRYVSYLSDEEHGVIFGDGAPHFGLLPGTRIHPLALRNLLEGNLPDGRPGVQKQQKKGKSHQAGVEMVFSTSKYFDCIYGAASPKLRKRLRKMFRVSVERQLRRIEERYAKSRKGRGGKEVVPTRLTFFCFFHDTNRENEPHLHCHVVIPNIGMREDGKVRTVLSKPFYRAQRCLGALFDHDLSHSLTEELGYTIRRNGWSYLIGGVPEKLAERWSTRSRQIREQLQKIGDSSFKAAQIAAKATRKKKVRTGPSIHSDWQKTAAEHGFDPERIVDPARIGRPPLSERTQALFADAAVFDAAEAITLAGVDFTEDNLTAFAAVRCLGSRVTIDALLAAVDRAVTRPLGHGLATDGQIDGDALFKRWDPPDPPVVTRLPSPVVLSSETSVAAPLAPNAATSDVFDATNNHHRSADRSAFSDSPNLNRESERADAVGSRARLKTQGDSQSLSQPASRPNPRSDPQPPKPDSRKTTRSTPTPENPPRRSLLIRDRITLWLAPVRAWILVRKGTHELAALRGHFTRSELLNYLVSKKDVTGIPTASVVREVSRAFKNLNRHKLVPVGRGGGEVVFTTHRQKKLELAVIRLADSLSARLGRRVKERYRQLAAALVRDSGAEEAARFLTDRPRLRLLDARPGDEHAALLNHVARAHERAGGRVHWLAPTSLGAEDLRRRTGNDAMTVGAFLWRFSPLPTWQRIRHLSRRPFRSIWRIAADAERLRKPIEHLTRRDIVVVDLAQLLGTNDLHHLLKAVHRSRAKIIFAGDSEGLPSSVAGGGWQYLTTRLPVARVESREQQARSPETEAADHIRKGRTEAAVQILREEGRITFTAQPAEAVDRLLAAYKLNGGLRDPARHLVVTGSKADAAHLNRRIQRERLRAGHLGYATARISGGKSVRRGDRVTFSRPSRKLNIRSGERGEVTFVNPVSATVWVRTDSGRSVTVPLRQFPHLELAYAATAARSSGLDVDLRYSFVRGPAFVRGAVLSVLEKTRERSEFFTSLSKAALAATIARRGDKRLAVAHSRNSLVARPSDGRFTSPAASGLAEMPAMDPM